MAIKKSDLYSKLWESCNDLRGSMDASQYKDYVLAILFIKYISDKWANTDDAFPPIVIPEGSTFKDMLTKKKRYWRIDELSNCCSINRKNQN